MATRQTVITFGEYRVSICQVFPATRYLNAPPFYQI